MDRNLYDFLAAMMRSVDGIKEHLRPLIATAEFYGLDEVEQYKPLVDAMRMAETTPHTDL